MIISDWYKTQPLSLLGLVIFTFVSGRGTLSRIFLHIPPLTRHNAEACPQVTLGSLYYYNKTSWGDGASHRLLDRKAWGSGCWQWLNERWVGDRRSWLPTSVLLLHQSLDTGKYEKEEAKQLRGMWHLPPCSITWAEIGHFEKCIRERCKPKIMGSHGPC